MCGLAQRVIGRRSIGNLLQSTFELCEGHRQLLRNAIGARLRGAGQMTFKLGQGGDLLVEIRRQQQFGPADRTDLGQGTERSHHFARRISGLGQDVNGAPGVRGLQLGWRNEAGQPLAELGRGQEDGAEDACGQEDHGAELQRIAFPRSDGHGHRDIEPVKLQLVFILVKGGKRRWYQGQRGRKRNARSKQCDDCKLGQRRYLPDQPRQPEHRKDHRDRTLHAAAPLAGQHDRLAHAGPSQSGLDMGQHQYGGQQQGWRHHGSREGPCDAVQPGIEDGGDGSRQGNGDDGVQNEWNGEPEPPDAGQQHCQRHHNGQANGNGKIADDLTGLALGCPRKQPGHPSGACRQRSGEGRRFIVHPGDGCRDDEPGTAAISRRQPRKFRPVQCAGFARHLRFDHV